MKLLMGILMSLSLMNALSQGTLFYRSWVHSKVDFSIVFWKNSEDFFFQFLSQYRDSVCFANEKIIIVRSYTDMGTLIQTLIVLFFYLKIHNSYAIITKLGVNEQPNFDQVSQ